MNGIALSPLTMIRLPFLLGFFLLLTGSAPFADAASSGQEQGDGGVVHIGIQETLDPEFFVDTLGPTMRHLRKRFPHLRFHAETFSIAELSQAIQTKSISFFIADSGLFTFLASTEHADDLATRQNRFSSDPAKSTGAVLFVRADRNDLQTLSDLRGRKIAAQNPNDFTSWLTFQGELVRAGFDPKKFWGAELFTEYEYPNVLDSVSAGETDAGLLAACALEEQTALHGYRLEDFRVLHEQTSNALRCRRSTALYPGPVFASLPHADPALTKQITLALLTEPPSENSSAWGISTDNSEALNLYKLLKTGPYSYLNDTNWSALWANYQEWIFAAFGLLMLLIIHTLRVDRLVERRTAELQASIAERDALEKANQANAQMLAQMERAGIVAQLSSMVAHELRQPLMSIMNFVGGLSLYMRKTYPADPVVAQTADVIVEEAERASAIVDRVRGYDKTAHAQKIPIAAKDLIASAVRAFSHSALSSGVTVRTDCRTNACVLGDPLELTLVILNFLKNAADAMADVSEKVIHLSAQQSGGNIVFRVRDYGPPLTNEVFETLSHPTVSHKPHGLGLGLSLAKSIAERHRGHIDFVRAQPNGLIAVLELPCLLNTSPSEAGTTVLQDSGQRKTHHE